MVSNLSEGRELGKGSRQGLALVLVFLLVFCLRLDSSPIRSQEPPTRAVPVEVDPAKKADIRRLLELMGGQKLVRQMATHVFVQAEPIFVKSLPMGGRNQQIADRFLQKLVTLLETGEFAERSIPFFARQFTHEEIKGLLQFFASPLGRRYSELVPQVMPDSRPAFEQWGREIVPAILFELEKEFPELKKEAQPKAPIRVSGEVMKRKLLRRVTPEYPPQARAARIEGTVKLEAVIGRDGTVQDLRVLEGHALLVEAAERAVRQWQYEPILFNNQPVEVVTLIDVVFKLR